MSHEFPSERDHCHFLYTNQPFDEKFEKISTFFYFYKNFESSVSDGTIFEKSRNLLIFSFKACMTMVLISVIYVHDSRNYVPIRFDKQMSIK